MKKFIGRCLQLGIILLVAEASAGAGFDLKDLPETVELRNILSQQPNSDRMVKRFDFAIMRLEKLSDFIHSQAVNENESKFLDAADKMFKETAKSFSDVVSKPTKKDGIKIEEGYQEYLQRVALIFKKALGENNSEVTNGLIMKIFERRFNEVSRLKDYNMYQKAADILRGQFSAHDALSSFTVLLIGLSIQRTSVVVSAGVVAWYLRTRSDSRDGQIQFDLVNAILTGNQGKVCEIQMSDKKLKP